MKQKENKSDVSRLRFLDTYDQYFVLEDYTRDAVC